MFGGSFKFEFAVVLTAAILVVDINAQSQGTCSTQRNEVGVCVPISQCESVKQQIAAGSSGELLPLSVVKTVRQLICGTFNGVSHVCCKQSNVGREIALTSMSSFSGRNGYCSTSNVHLGVPVCVPILTCGSTIELLQRSPIPLPATVAQTVKQTHCGTFGNVHHVCCPPNHVTSERSSTPKYTTEMAVVTGVEAETQGSCVTLRNETGVCVPVRSCQTIVQLLQLSGGSEGHPPPSVSEIVRRSYCGTYNVNDVRVCCKQNRVIRRFEPTISTATRFGTSSEAEPVSCRTELNQPGVCVPMLTCGTTTRTLQNAQEATPLLPVWAIRTVKQSHCGTFSNIYHVCCKHNEVKKNNTRTSDFDYFVEGRGSCRTQDDVVGLCVPMLTCAPIIELLQTSSGASPLSPSTIEAVTRSHCGTFNNVHHVCCKLRNPSRSATSTRRPTRWF